MKPIKFPGSNILLAKYQTEYQPLYTYRRKDSEMRGEITICWKFSWKERLLILLHGKFWLTVLTFNNPLQPISLHIDKPVWVPDRIETETTTITEYTK